MMPSESLVENNTQGKDVGAAVDRLLQQDFRRHVSRRSAERPSAVDGRVILRAENLFSHAKIQNLDLPGGRKHDVFRLDIPVEDAAIMGGNKSFSALTRDMQKFLELNGPRQALPQRLPFHELHDEKELVLRLQEIVDRSHTRLIAHLRRALRFLHETAAVQRIVAQ